MNRRILVTGIEIDGKYCGNLCRFNIPIVYVIGAKHMCLLFQAGLTESKKKAGRHLRCKRCLIELKEKI